MTDKQAILDLTPDRLKELRKIAEAAHAEPYGMDHPKTAAFMVEFVPSTILSLLDLIDRQREALAGMLDNFGGYCCPEVDTAITVMQEAGIDRWSMQSQIESTFEIPK